MRISHSLTLITVAGLTACSRHPAIHHTAAADSHSDRDASIQPESAQVTVFVHDSDVWVHIPPDTGYSQVTHVGLVKEARLSPDDKWIAYVLDTPGDTVDGAIGRVAATAIWLVRADGSDGKQLVRGHDSSENDIGDFRTLRFSPDGQRLYFSSEAAPVTDAVHVVTTDSGQESLVCLGQLDDVVPRGLYAGDLILGQHRYLGERPGSYDVGGLFTPDCLQIMELAVDSEGTSYDSINAFYARFVPPPMPHH